MTADEMIGLLLPIEEYLKEQARHADDPVDAELASHYAFTIRKIAEELAENF